MLRSCIGEHPTIQDTGGLSSPPEIKGICRHPYVQVRHLAQGWGKHPLLWESISGSLSPASPPEVKSRES